jgi:iron(III) transport system permease protein
MLRGSLVVEGSFSLAHYASLLDPTQRANVEAMMNSVLVSLFSVLFSCIIGVLLALTFTQLDFPFRVALSRAAVLPIALPPLVGVISFLFVFGESGFLPRLIQLMVGSPQVPFSLDGISAIVAVHVYSFYVYFYLFVSNALRQLDPSLMEASASLGGGGWRTFTRIVLPALRPSLVSASVLTFMASMASFSAPLIFGGEHRFLTTQIYSTKLNGELDLASAQSVVLTGISIVFFIVLSRSRGGHSAPASKGAARQRPMMIPAVTRKLLIGSAIALLTVGSLPILTIVLISFVREGSWTWQLLPTEFSPDNYLKLLREPRVFEPLWNSVVMGLLTVLAAVIVGVTAAFLLVKGGLRRGRLFAEILVNLPFAIPGTVIAIGLILAFNTPTFLSGYTVLVGTFWILPLAYLIRTYPLVVRATMSALAQVDNSLMEAGHSFGAGGMTVFRRILLPIIAPGIASGALLTLIAALGEFVSSILLYSYSSRPVAVEILSQLRAYNFGAAAAYCVVLLVVITGLTFIMTGRRRSVRGGEGINF